MLWGKKSSKGSWEPEGPASHESKSSTQLDGHTLAAREFRLEIQSVPPEVAFQLSGTTQIGKARHVLE